MRSQVHQLVATQAADGGDRPALTFKDVTLSYTELDERIRLTGTAFRALGLAAGDRVAIYLDKRVETVVSIFAASAGAGVFVPVNPLLRPRQVSHILQDCDVRILVTTAERLESLKAELGDCKALDQVVLVGGGAAEPFGTVTVTPWDDALSAGAADVVAPAPERIDTDVAAILYTSGSTGAPKGVVLSHRNMIAGAESVASYLRNSADDVILSVLPLSFDAGLSQLTTGFVSGAHVVLLNYLLPADVVKLCAQHGVTGLTCVPPLWIQIAAQKWPAEVAQKLRYFANTGGRMPRSTLEKLRAIFTEASPYLMYGLTEAFRSTYLDPVEVDRRPDSIGKAIPNAEILVVRPDGSICDAGEEGELVHRGALVSLGYWNDPEKTAARFKPAPGRDGEITVPELAVFSGDTVIRDDEGFLYFVGRKDDMIKTSGYRVSPTEVEEVAYETGLVHDAVALGISDDRLGQRIVLAVALVDDTDEAAVLAAMKSVLPPYMVPAELVVRDRLPRSPNGKFDRNLLREEVSGR